MSAQWAVPSPWPAVSKSAGMERALASRPSSSYDHWWYGHTKRRFAVPCGVSHSANPRWRQTLCSARTVPSATRTTMSG